MNMLYSSLYILLILFRSKEYNFENFEKKNVGRVFAISMSVKSFIFKENFKK